MNHSWSIIIIAYNEEETIASVIDQTQKFLKQNDIPDNEIIVVDDGSVDNSQKIIGDIVKISSNIKYVRHPMNMGIGHALLSGYKNAKKENAVMIPADGQFDINEISSFKNFREGTYLSFYRGEMNYYTLFRKFITRMNKSFNKYILNLLIRDVNWVKAYKTSDLRSLNLQLESSLVGSEICAKLNIKGIEAEEIPSVYHKRIAGVAKGASYKNLMKAVNELAALALIIRRFKKENMNK